MPQRSFLRLFDANARLRVSFTTERGRVSRFVVQLEVLCENEWRAAIRYDNAHDFAHCDVLHADGTQEKSGLAVFGLGEALTHAIEQIEEHWKEHRERFLRELEA